ncbi:MAG TPA: hypothetical protein VFU49_02030, partial [Ktedonobacteraceae bacterium]|nr:hypothetical protein [Ktedonobacteraceae bacterium]
MYSLGRLLFRALAGKPLAQLIVGIGLIPAGGLLSFAAMSGDYIYPYWIVAGVAFAIIGIIFIVRGAAALLRPKPSVQQAFFASQGQYPPQAPYGQSQYPQQAPYGQPQSPYPQQAPYGQPQYPQAPYGQQ